MNKEKWTRKHT